jgi:hypothetical protein
MSTYALKASPGFTGTPTGPTATAGTNTTQLATCAFVVNNSAGSNLLSTANTWSAIQTFSAVPVLSGASISANTIPIGSINGNATLCTLTGTQTLTNKTITNPKISSITNTGTLTLPTTTGTIALTSQIVDLTNNQSISGNKTFNNQTNIAILNITGNSYGIFRGWKNTIIQNNPTLLNTVCLGTDANIQNNPNGNSNDLLNYFYNVSGKTLYLSFEYWSNSLGSTGGTGIYYYRIPAIFQAYIDTTAIGSYFSFTAYSGLRTPNSSFFLDTNRLRGLKVGNGMFEIANVLISSVTMQLAYENNQDEFCLLAYTHTNQYQSATIFQYNQAPINYSFQCQIPLQ